MRTFTLLLCLLALAVVTAAQETTKAKPAAPAAASPAPAAAPADAENPYSAWNRHAYGKIEDILVRAAEKMPEADYGFRPAESVRSYGEIVGHLASSQYYFCSTALGEANPAAHAQKPGSAKAELIAGLKESNAYCEKAYASLNDATGRTTVKMFHGTEDVPKLDALHVNNMHDMEHYGNLVTYLRMKNIVPPTSEKKD